MIALAAAALAADARRATAGDHPPPPQLPLAQWWSVPLDGKVTAGPVASGGRVYLAYASGAIVARDGADGHELWRQQKTVTLPMAVDGDLLFVSSGEAVEALRGATGASAWILPRTKTVAPLVAASGWLVATTDADVIAIHAADGKVAWRHAAGGVKLPPAVAEERVFTGAEDGRVLALTMSDGAEVWEQFVPGGVTAIAAYRDRVYVGTGEKLLYCLEAARKASYHWVKRLGGLPAGRMPVDDERIYLTAYDNVVRALDRQNGNQRWQAPLRQRATFGVFASGHVVFAPAVTATEVQMMWDRGGRSGTLTLPGETPPDLAPAIVDSKDGPVVFAVTGGLTNEWSLTKFAPAGDTVLVPVATLDAMPGLPFLTDPELQPLVTVLKDLIAGDPPLVPLSSMEFPIVLKDPPLLPLTTLPGLPLRPLSPVLPVRRAAPGPGD